MTRLGLGQSAPLAFIIHRMTRRLIRTLVLALFLAHGVEADEPLLEPVLDSDMQMRADSATLVQDGATKLLLLEGDVSVSIGGYGFRDQQAVVRIRRRPGVGEPIRDFAIVFDRPTADGSGGVKADARGLLVTVANRGKVQLAAELTRANAVPESPFTRGALGRIAEYDQRVRKPRLGVPDDVGLSPEQLELREKRRAAIQAERREVEIPDPEADVDREAELVERPVLPARGAVRYGSVDRIVYQQGEDEDAVILIGGVRVMYEDEDEGRDVLLTAERIVIFLDKEGDGDAPATPSAQVDAGRVRGVYLEEGAVVSDGNTTVRAPRAFYDLRTDRAILLDAVVYSYDIRQRVPLYMRAEVIRQTSADSYTARDAVFTTSEFAQPHLLIGASRITLQREEQADGQTENWVTAEGVTLNAGQTPFFYWPAATVEAGRIPIRQVRVGADGDNGAEVQTRWDVFALAGKRAPDGVELLADVDVRGQHGLAVGGELDYDRGDSRGNVRGYVLPSDSGEDDIADRNAVDFDNETRGFIQARHRQNLPAGWEVWLDANHVSDPTFLEEFFPSEAYAAEPYETSAYFKKAEDDWALTALVSGNLNSFTPQYAPLLTPGYTVNKLPEAEYRLIQSVLDDRATLFHESRASRMQLSIGDDSPADRGFNAAQSAEAFGFVPGTSFDDNAAAAGLPRRFVNRFDSRTELAAPFRAGPIDITPFGVARITAYDDDFADFNGGNDDQARLHTGLGVRTSTQLTRAASGFSSELLDVNGLRHIVEPGVTLAYYDNTLDATSLPVFDPGVERLTEGAVTRLGVVNTWHTRRGGSGRSRTVDWLRLRTDVVLASEDAANPNTLGRYYDYRPEYTLGDDHFYTELMWAVTQASAITGELTHNFDQGSVVQWRLGIENEHTDRLTTYANYREIDVLDARLLSYGAALKLTTKYRVGVYHVIDVGDDSGSRTLNLTLDRSIPRATLGIVIGYDDIDGDASIGLVLTPQGGIDQLTGGLIGGR